MVRKVKEAKNVITELEMIFKLAGLTEKIKFERVGTNFILGLHSGTLDSIWKLGSLKKVIKNQGLKMIDMSKYEYIFVIAGHKRKPRNPKWFYIILIIRKVKEGRDETLANKGITQILLWAKET